ncbi:bifunctional hydroxymethylpyrimidine kinase/phosphomethylpyrimidine kinase [Sphingomonas yunnanensis]|uniref:bifunctional hydroxymethylpyrimidine kinase/phosphomethylpyrimidine kinase n=1 Tax=Sphingomonas yunnanensis TaxID=310400 RepID=UPI001CA6B21C|nr:bifunctional hydroxymethylpyrimidine kinase/phosphomethylpyrimidine kinase [Sphingomonas yunnanensis]MBY9064701.1 bifunctional hydroxymethylpyrimidine kinase/phosphomethylpyrimidine kinase [Sphingomonas yunnanensis]
MMPRVLIVAGSDSGGGAGIQADIKTVTMLGGHAMTAITAITAQNTLGVQAVAALSPDMVRQQMTSVVADLGVDSVKIGMLGGADIAAAVADELADGRYGSAIVLDPVMVASSGAVLADTATIAAFERLARLSALVTPNLPELAALCGRDTLTADEVVTAARDYAAAIGTPLLVKGGHAEGALVVDRLIGPAGEILRWEAPRIDTRHHHGTGCTLASAIAEGLARGLALSQAIERARVFVRVALREAPGLGAGHGPMGHARVRLDVAAAAPTLNHVTLPMTDHAATLAFYRGLGLTPIVASGARYARFESAGGTTLSIEAAHEIAGAPVVFLEVADVDAAVAHARAAGVVADEARDRPWGWREARLRDPSGNAVCLYQAGENRRFPPWRL